MENRVALPVTIVHRVPSVQAHIGTASKQSCHRRFLTKLKHPVEGALLPSNHSWPPLLTEIVTWVKEGGTHTSVPLEPPQITEKKTPWYLTARQAGGNVCLH